MKNRLLSPAFGAILAAVTVWSFEVPDAAGFQKPELARIFFWHFPMAILATALLLMGGFFAYRNLATRERHWDIRAAAANELGFLYCLATMASGIIFSEVQWGTWWHWDPRQTSFLLVLLIYFGYFAVRAAFEDEDRRAANSGGYALAALPAALFLIFVFPRLPQVAAASFHPTQSIMEGQIRGGYSMVTTALMITLGVLTIWLYRLRVKVELLTYDYGNMEADRGGAATHRVVGALPVSREDRPEGERVGT